MTTRKEAIAACLQFPDAFEDYPFRDANWTVMRHKTNKKPSHSFLNAKEKSGSASKPNRSGETSGRTRLNALSPPTI